MKQMKLVLIGMCSGLVMGRYAERNFNTSHIGRVQIGGAPPQVLITTLVIHPRLSSSAVLLKGGGDGMAWSNSLLNQNLCSR